MTNIEKKMLGAMILFITVCTLSISSCNYEIEKAGGWKRLIIESGKELKDMSEQINES